MKTLNHDELEPRANLNTIDAREPHLVLYGSKTWTDDIDSATLETLVAVGAVRFVRAIEGVVFETHIYESVKGAAPA